MSTPNNNRREFFRNLLLAGVAGAVLPSLITEFAQAEDLLPIDMTGKKRKDATNVACVTAAKNLHYHDDAKDLEKEFAGGKIGKPNDLKDKAGKFIAVKDRHCDKCALYGISKPGVCALINGCTVAAAGSCTSWSPKPGTF